MRISTSVRRSAKGVGRKLREARLFAKAMHSPQHPILAQIVPIRRCNLACAYCNEFDAVSPPVPTGEMLRRIDQLAALGCTIITISGGEPMLHPDLDLLIRRIRERGAVATLITNGYFLVPERIRELNRAGLDYVQISIDNVDPDETSKKSLKVLDRKLQWLAEYAEFSVTVNSVLGSPVRHPADALTVARRARHFGFTSTVGILHDGNGQAARLSDEQLGILEEILKLEKSVFSFAHYDRFQRSTALGLPHTWHCRAGGRFLYICEDGLVHYCSQYRGRPGIPLAEYGSEDLQREARTPKPCAAHCTVSCVHQTAMLDDVREDPRGMLRQLIERRRVNDPSFQTPAMLRMLAWMFLDSQRSNTFRRVAIRVFGLGGARD
jgi:MoaA/NifB/PqqE/SkfB family radical SAM enzyme